ncbi:MAG TPA: hypothetical protein VFU93_01610 [Acidimicrobiales bacterium]|nr:hypothetical protein [Acidimicrobiales bacterium]
MATELLYLRDAERSPSEHTGWRRGSHRERHNVGVHVLAAASGGGRA